MNYILKKSIPATCNCFSSLRQKSRAKSMTAWQAFEHGGPEKLQLNTVADIPIIENSSNVLIKVHAASLNPLDKEMLRGYGSTAFNFVRQLNNCSLTANEFPLVLGRDFSGVVSHVGKKVKNFQVGDEVWGALSPWQNGTFAEYVLAPSCYISKKPKTIDHIEASSFPYASLTAWAALKTFGGLTEKNAYGKRVLIIGASGGVGTFAVQLLKSWGADVTVICKSDAAEMLTNLGADCVLDYESTEFKHALRDLKQFDLIFDNIGKHYPDQTINLLKSWKNSKYVTVVSPLLKNADDRGLLLGTVMTSIQAGLDTAMSLKDGKSFRWAYFMPNSCALKKIAQMIDNKQINPVIQKVYSFDKVPHAFEKLEEGHARGKTVIDILSSYKENNQTVQNNKAS